MKIDCVLFSFVPQRTPALVPTNCLLLDNLTPQYFKTAPQYDPANDYFPPQYVPHTIAPPDSLILVPQKVLYASTLR